MAQSLANIVIHLIFSTKERREMITQTVQDDLYGYMAGILQNLGAPAVIIGGTKDHVHILFNHPKTLAVAKVVEEVKRGSSKWIKTKGREFNAFAWQNGYGAFSVSESNVDAVKTYISRQEEHHKKFSFQDELRRFLEKNKIKFDEKYLWD
jgi:putative transposase